MKTSIIESNIYTIEDGDFSLVTGNVPKNLNDDEKIDITLRLMDGKNVNIYCTKEDLIGMSKLLRELVKQIGE